jgi:hypothetical protein
MLVIYITYISLSLRRTSAPIHLTSVLGMLGTQETSCILIAGLLKRDNFDLFLPEFDKPWVIHLRETCWCSSNLCTWRRNTVYKNRSVRRHQCCFTNLYLIILQTINVLDIKYLSPLVCFWNKSFSFKITLILKQFWRLIYHEGKYWSFLDTKLESLLSD